MKYILALDQGTTSSRALLFDKSGNERGIAQQEFKQYFPQPGWVEHDPEEIWTSQIAVVNKLLRNRFLSIKDVAAIGITNQRETVVVWNKETGKSIYPAIVWQDRRTADLCTQLKVTGHEKTFVDKTGLLLDPYFSGTKLKWILDNVHNARALASEGKLAFGTIDSWLIWKLSEGQLHITDASNASRTLLYNIHTGDWDKELLDLLDIPLEILPAIKDSSGIVGYTSPSVTNGSVPIAGIAGDQQAALFGQACHFPGMVKNTYGTGCFMLMHTGTKPVKSQAKLLSTIAWQKNGIKEYALEGSVFVAGAVVQWLRDGLGIIRSSNDVESLATSVNDNGGVYFVPAFTGLGAPYWDAYARGSLIGLTRGSTKAHIARAALESIAFQTADVVTAMCIDSGIPLTELRVDGGATRNNFLMQFQADLLGVPVIRPKVIETTAQGAAFLAGLAIGFWQDGDEIFQQWQQEARFEPQMDREKVKKLHDGWLECIGKVTSKAERLY